MYMLNYIAPQVLVIDELSMVSAELFEELERRCRNVRGVDAPFGGLQLVLCGDFFQVRPACLLVTLASSTISSGTAVRVVLCVQQRLYRAA